MKVVVLYRIIADQEPFRKTYDDARAEVDGRWLVVRKLGSPPIAFFPIDSVVMAENLK